MPIENNPVVVRNGEARARLAEALIPAVLAAGRVAMAHYATPFAVDKKADDSPVTLADRDAEAVLLAALSEAAPGVPVIAEEAGEIGAAMAQGDAFLVDPLDGTREFISKNGEFTVNVALIAEGQPVVGLVLAPAIETLYVGVAGMGAYVCYMAMSEPPAALHSQRFQALRPRPPQRDQLSALVSRSHMDAETDGFLVAHGVVERLPLGSSLKLCAIAEGRADLYPRFGRTMEWDIAAGQAVLAAAGGCVTTLDGEPLRYGKRLESFANPSFIAWSTPRPFLAL